MAALQINRAMKNRTLKVYLLIAVLFLLSALAASYCKMDGLKLLEFEFVATTTGILLGFGITIYTFIVQLLQPIIENLTKKISDQDKIKQWRGLLRSAEKELRQDLWLIFFALLIVLIIGIVSHSVDLTFNFGLYFICCIPETLYIFVYLLSFRALFDLMSALFSIGEITILLLNTDDITPNNKITEEQQENE